MSRKLNILYLHQYFATPDVAAGTRSYEFSKRLIQAGHNVTMVTSSAFLPEPFRLSRTTQEIMIEGIRVIVVPLEYSNSMSFDQRIWAFLSFAWKASWISIPDKIDVVFATSTPLTIAIPGIIQKLRHAAPLVFEVRDLWPEMPIAMGALRNPFARLLARALEWIAYRSSRRIVALSPGMAAGVVRGGGNPSKVTVITNGCDLELFNVPPEVGLTYRREILGIDNQTPILVYAGTFGHVNGVGYAVEMARHLQQRGAKAKIVLVGTGVQKAAVLELARKYGVLGKTVLIMDSLPKREIPALFSAATAIASLFIPVKEMWHNSANKFFDALAASKPVVINYGGWQAEMLQNSGAGLVIAHDNPELAADQLAHFLNDKARLNTAGMAARKLAVERFDRDKLAQQLEKVLLDAVLPPE